MSAKHTQNRKDYQTPELLDYIQQRMAPEDDRHDVILRAMRKSGLPEIQIGAMEGKILQYLAKSCRASKAVEIGTLGGYSAAWIADSLPEGGKLYTLEIDPESATLAAASLKAVGLSERVAIVIGNARETLRTLEPFGPFDFCFIDADKVGYPDYLRWAARHLRSGGIVALDNAYLFGKVHLSRPSPEEAPAVLAMQEVITILTDRSCFSACTMIPTGEGLAVGVTR